MLADGTEQEAVHGRISEARGQLSLRVSLCDRTGHLTIARQDVRHVPDKPRTGRSCALKL
jgi:hypothetical protein